MALYCNSLSVFLASLLLSWFCLISLAESKNNGGFTLDLIPRDSALSPSYDPSITRFERLRKELDRSFTRKSSLSSASLRPSSDVEAPITPNGGGYLMKIQIGTPPVELVAVADTGSDLTWTQCEPCTSCYSQDPPLFDPSKTSSYRSVSCQSNQCSSLGTSSSSCDTNNVCRYKVSYGDRSYSQGELATETLTFDQNVNFPKVVFGCGHRNDGQFTGNESGIIGLGGGAVSIINQLKRPINGKFSYCLTLRDSNVPSKISFGNDAVVAGPNVVTTPLVKGSRDTFYYLTLEGISVGTERLEYKSNGKQASDEGNIIIDSGTTLTFIPSEFYDELKSALEKAINGDRIAVPQGFDLCYRILGEGELRSPPITAHFKGADVVLPQAGVFLELEQGIYCLTFVPSEDIAIFGNLHQMNYKIGYDLVKQELNFLPTDCAKSQ